MSRGRVQGKGDTRGTSPRDTVERLHSAASSFASVRCAHVTFGHGLLAHSSCMYRRIYHMCSKRR